MKKPLVLTLALAISAVASFAQNKPTGLMTDLIERTDVVYMNGYVTSMTLEEMPLAIESVQCAAIATEKPRFSWIVNGIGHEDVVQEAYRIEVYRLVNEKKGKGTESVRKVVWDSGKVASSQSSAVEYAGEPLEPNTVYYWSVTNWTNKTGESRPSDVKAFRTASELKPYAISIEPQIKEDQYPASVSTIKDSNLFVDFGKAAFGQLRIRLTASEDGEKVILHLGERIKDGSVDRKPFGSCRYRKIELTLRRGTHTYFPKILPDYRNTHGDAVLMPDYIGEVLPFRYLEVEGYKEQLAITDVVRMAVFHPSNERSSDFRCSNDILNQIWDLCKYSMKATSFIGYHIDGDRERIPYELDGLINQLCVYGTDNIFSLSRRSTDYLLDHPTWPTEWILQMVMMAWDDYLYTGDDRLLAERYDMLCKHTLSELKCENGLISTKAKAQDKDFLSGINRSEALKDIVDWPQGKGSFGLPDSHPGEADFFEFSDYNAVVNAYHCKTLEIMSDVAAALGKEADAAKWKSEFETTRKQYNKLLFNLLERNYRDGVGLKHSALHSNMFPMAFGLVPQQYVSRVADFIQTKGMACSIGNAKFLLDALYDAGRADYALRLLTSEDERGWYNTILKGSTMTYEAWDDKFKKNQDWNHAWGGAPADIIPHKLLGVEPLEPAWDKMLIHPQIAGMTSAKGVIPTVKGPVTIDISKDYESYNLFIDIPANTKAQVLVPVGAKGLITVNGELVKGVRDASKKYFVFEVGSGKRTFVSF